MSEIGKILHKLETFIPAAYIVLGLIPGALVILGLVPIPPSLKGLISFIVGTLGLATFVVLLLLRVRIEALSPLTAAVLFGGMIIGGCIAAIGYFEFAQAHVTTHGSELIVLPLEYQGQLRDIVVEGFRGDVQEALNSEIVGSLVRRLIDDQNTNATWAMAALMSACEILIIGGLFGGALRLLSGYADEEQ